MTEPVIIDFVVPSRTDCSMGLICVIISQDLRIYLVISPFVVHRLSSS